MFDWFTLIAQLVNFLVLVWLLKRFLYKQILKAIDEREKLIALQLHDAEASKTQANKELESYQQKNTLFDKQRQELFDNAVIEVNAERQKLLEQTRNEVESLRLRLLETVKSEQQHMSSEIIRRTRTEIFAIARKTLADLASVNLEEQMTNVLISRINGMKSDEKDRFNSIIKQSSQDMLVRSTFELPPAQQSAIKNAINENLNIETNIKFDAVPHLVSGIELVSNGFKISWTIEDYLGSIETRITELLDKKTETVS